MRRRVGRPGLVGTMARTAVVAGTATAVHGSMTKKSQSKAQAEADNQTAQQQAYDNEAQMADMQRQLDESKAQKSAAAPAAEASSDLVAELSKLADLKAAGVLSDEEFAEAKAKLLSG